MRFVFIQAHERIFHITVMCRVLEVSRAGYYAWRARPLCDRMKDDRALSERIRQIHKQVKERYGSPRVRVELKALGIRCGKKRVARLMRLEGLKRRAPGAFALRPNLSTPSRWRPTFSIGNSPRPRSTGPTASGRPISPTSRRVRAGCISQSYSILPRGASWAGRFARGSIRSSLSRRSRWRFGTAVRTAGCITPIAVCSTRAPHIANCSRTRGSRRA